jgi:hypothetical protein
MINGLYMLGRFEGKAVTKGYVPKDRGGGPVRQNHVKHPPEQSGSCPCHAASRNHN